MSNQAIFWLGLMSATATIPIVQMAATAATAPEIAKTAKAITVQITEPGSRGSGVILQRQGDIYTVLTNEHVLRAKNVPYKIVTSDGKKYQAIPSSIRLPSVDIDLAVVKFRASDNYPTAKLGNCNLLTEGMDLYVGGYPAPTVAITNSVFLFRTGTVSANSNQTLEKGYSLIYSNDTLPGMSGGAVLNQNGELVAIHGRGDVQKNSDGEWGAKTGFNLGIPINRFATIASSLGVDLIGKVAAISKSTQPKAGDYFALGVQKSRKGDYRGSLDDFNKAIQTNPSYAIVYNYRGVLKQIQLNDSQGALADFNQSIRLDPNFAIAYYNRGSLKNNTLNDIQGALADFNQSIRLGPNYAIAYGNRGFLRYQKLNDQSGGIADMQKSARLLRQQNNVEAYQQAIDQLKKWGVTDRDTGF